MLKNKGNIARTAFGFVLIIGIVNLFADMTYEGARSITGPFLGSLGASATVVGVVAGTGELLGYSLRSVAGYFALHSHMLVESPRPFFMHFWANDDAMKLARGIRAALDKTNSAKS
jgi:uncharacterized protein DUF1259